jgi:hypothetical protein
VTFKVDPEVEAPCRVKNKPVPALPSPSLLAIRVAFSRVAHMAGAAEQADQILRDLEETPVITNIKIYINAPGSKPEWLFQS